MQTSKLIHEEGKEVKKVREAPTIAKPIWERAVEPEPEEEFNFQSKNKIVVNYKEMSAKQ